MNEQQQRALAKGLEALAGSTKASAASPQVEAAVLAEFTRMKRPVGGGVARRRPDAAWLAIAAILTLASVAGVWLSQGQRAGVQPGMHQAGFTVIPGTGYLPPMESAAIVRVELPVTALPSYGIQIMPDMVTDSVDADLLVAQDGLPRGIRLVNNSQTSRSTP